MPLNSTNFSLLTKVMLSSVLWEGCCLATTITATCFTLILSHLPRQPFNVESKIWTELQRRRHRCGVKGKMKLLGPTIYYVVLEFVADVLWCAGKQAYSNRLESIQHHLLVAHKLCDSSSAGHLEFRNENGDIISYCIYLLMLVCYVLGLDMSHVTLIKEELLHIKLRLTLVQHSKSGPSWHHPI